MYRILKPHGRLVMSDPTCEQPMNDALRNDDRLRALCLSGAIPLKDYIKMLTDVGFGTIEIRARRPYRILDTAHYATDENIFIESVEVCAIKTLCRQTGPVYLQENLPFTLVQRTILTTKKAMYCFKTSLFLSATKPLQLWVV
jgi:hypothetical protein